MTDLLIKLFANAGLALPMIYGEPFVPNRLGKVGLSKEGMPRFHSGAKLRRKAVQKAVAVKHPRGLRLDGVTV